MSGLGGMTMVSEGARGLLTELQHQPEPLLCLECTGMRLSLTKWEVTKLIGELIDGDAVHCRRLGAQSDRPSLPGLPRMTNTPCECLSLSRERLCDAI